MKKFKSILCLALAGLSMSSCKDFLTLMPLNEIVLENFWTDKSDVESVLLGAYSALEKSDCVVRMSIWGEMRSDNIVAGKSNDENDDIILITKDNILETNSYTKYKCFYDVINRANTVLHFAPIVAGEDPNYNYDELKNNEAEAIAIRSLCYWYLIRAYKDVPYVTEPSIDDTHDFFVGQMKFDQILDSLITDLESYKGWAVNRYTVEAANTARFTRSAMYAMLADMYLWKGDYDKCIENCELVTDRKLFEYDELIRKDSKNCTVELFNGYPLITDVITGTEGGNSYNEIFGKGNSFETLFELPYDSEKKNPFVESYYNSKSSTIGKLKAFTDVGSGFGPNGNVVFTSPTDGRYFQNVKQADSEYGIMKYVYEDITYDLSDANGNPGDAFEATKRENTQPNWIVYRYSDVLLMEAEAKVQKAAQMGADTASTEVKTLLTEAFNLVDAVNSRAIAKEQNGDASKPLKVTDYKTVTAMDNLVLAERRRELLFEGKRWFDLVRMSMREGNTSRLLSFVTKKHSDATSSAVQIRLSEMNALFFPLNKDEIKINSKLIQNPIYVENEDIQKAK